MFSTHQLQVGKVLSGGTGAGGAGFPYPPLPPGPPQCWAATEVASRGLYPFILGSSLTIVAQELIVVITGLLYIARKVRPLPLAPHLREGGSTCRHKTVSFTLPDWRLRSSLRLSCGFPVEEVNYPSMLFMFYMFTCFYGSC